MTSSADCATGCGWPLEVSSHGSVTAGVTEQDGVSAGLCRDPEQKMAEGKAFCTGCTRAARGTDCNVSATMIPVDNWRSLERDRDKKDAEILNPRKSGDVRRGFTDFWKSHGFTMYRMLLVELRRGRSELIHRCRSTN